MKTHSLALSSVLSVAFAIAAAQSFAAAGFGTDYDAALARSRAEGRPMLVLFTGSDWCPYCIKLEREILSQPAFLDFATNRYELVELDFPRSEGKVSAAQKARNAELAGKFKIRGYPTILVLDKDENVVVKSGYERGGAEKWVESFREISARATLRKAHLEPFAEEADRLRSEMQAAMASGGGAKDDWGEAAARIAAKAKEVLPQLEALRAKVAALEVPDALSGDRASLERHVVKSIEMAKSILSTLEDLRKAEGKDGSAP